MVSKNWDQSFFWFTTWKIWIASGSFSTSFIYQLHQQHQISASFYLNIILNKNWTVENTILIEEYVCRNFQNSYKNVAKTLVFKLLWNGTYMLLGFNFFFIAMYFSWKNPDSLSCQTTFHVLKKWDPKGFAWIGVRVIGYYFHYADNTIIVTKRKHTVWVEPKSQVLLVNLK